MNLTDSRLAQAGNERLELAMLSFFEQFRKIYIGDQVQKSSKVKAHKSPPPPKKQKERTVTLRCRAAGSVRVLCPERLLVLTSRFLQAAVVLLC